MQATNFVFGNTMRIIMMTVMAFTNLLVIGPFGFAINSNNFYGAAFGQFFGQPDTSIR
jgi:hypothetical protein